METPPAHLTLPDAPPHVAQRLSEGAAVAWSDPLTITTYSAGEPSSYPMYLDHRVYQGSSGRVYPLPFVESIADESAPRVWQAIHLENAYVRLVVLPELGGRIHIGFDKSTGQDFFYRNNVIKPALVGLGGPWISGGVELNWPQHHRPATYLPVEASIEQSEDGAVTVWCHDHEPFERMSAHHGVRLRPDSSVVELVVRLHNRASVRQTFLWWANVAAAVNADYQSFFPEDVRYVADHARRAITAFPRADRPYYGVDYPALAQDHPGADRIDFYRNIPVPTSYMIVDSVQDFFGGYDHGAGSGFVHWAERRISPGKKQWTWGDAPFGHAWDAQLTDSGGPYVELMAGVYTDNQPDFSWLLPGETKTFTQCWYPIGAIGPAHQATPDAAVNVDRSTPGRITASFAVTSPQAGAHLTIHDGATRVSEVRDLHVGVPERLVAEVTPGPGTRVELRDSAGRLLVAWTPPEAPTGADAPEPWVATEPPGPEETGSVDELYLTGLHLAQYRHPTRSPLPYWNEALTRDPGHADTHLALGERAYRAGRYAEALDHADAALARLTRRNTNPLSAEAYYLRGLALARLNRAAEAEAAFGKAGWDGTWAAAAGLELTRLLAASRRNRAALRVLDSLEGAVGHDPRRAAARAVVLRRVGREVEARDGVGKALAADPLDATLRVLAGENPPRDAGTLYDCALDLWKLGEAEESLALLEAVLAAPVTPAGNWRPLAHYTAAAMLDSLGRADEAAAQREAARVIDATWAFPNGLDQHDALVAAVRADPDDATAALLLGELLYAHERREEAAELWEGAIAGGGDSPVLLRNAGLAAFNVSGDDSLVWSRYARAVEIAPADARLRYEQDQLAARLGHSNAERLARLEEVRELVLSRDDLTIAFVGLLTAQGRAAESLEILTSRHFHPWEGGEGLTLAAWDAARAALDLPLADPPANLGEARPLYVPPVARHADGETDYFATSLPDLLLFTRAVRP